MLHREHLGAWRDRATIEEEPNAWIRQYSSDMEAPPPVMKPARPLRQAEVVVSEVEGQPRWHEYSLKVSPNWKYMGGVVELSLVGKLDKSGM